MDLELQEAKTSIDFTIANMLKEMEAVQGAVTICEAFLKAEPGTRHTVVALSPSRSGEIGQGRGHNMIDLLSVLEGRLGPRDRFTRLVAVATIEEAVRYWRSVAEVEAVENRFPGSRDPSWIESKLHPIGLREAGLLLRRGMLGSDYARYSHRWYQALALLRVSPFFDDASSKTIRAALLDAIRRRTNMDGPEDAYRDPHVYLLLLHEYKVKDDDLQELRALESL